MRKNKKTMNALNRINSLFNELKDIFNLDLKYDIMKGDFDKELEELKHKDFNKFVNQNKNYETILKLRIESYKTRISEFQKNIFNDEYLNPMQSLLELKISNPEDIIELWMNDYRLIEEFLKEYE